MRLMRSKKNKLFDILVEEGFLPNHFDLVDAGEDLHVSTRLAFKGTH